MGTNEPFDLVTAESQKASCDLWEFTPLDRACLRMVIRGTWIFDTPLNVQLMKDALGKTLSYYPHLAGRMKSQTGVTLTNEGVPFSMASEPDLLVEDVLKRDDMANIKHFSIAINPGRIMKGIDAPLSVKITELKNGAVLGVQCSHALMDGDSFYTMVYNWSKIFKGEEFEKPVIDQGLLPAPDDTPVQEIKAAALAAGWKQLSIFSIFKLLPAVVSGVIKKRSRPFYVSAATIERLKEEISNAAGIECSSNLALSALITRRCMELYDHSDDTRCSIVTVINTRKRLANIPATYAGNSSLSLATPPFPAKAGLTEIAAILHQTLEPARKSPSPELQELLQLSINTMNRKLPFAPFDVFGMHAKKPAIAYINNFSKLHIYDIDFGTGRPVKVIPHDLLDQVVIWPTSPEHGGVEVYFSGIPTRYFKQLDSNYLDVTL